MILEGFYHFVLVKLRWIILGFPSTHRIKISRLFFIFCYGDIKKEQAAIWPWRQVSW
jgi:hypothetical protein